MDPEALSAELRRGTGAYLPQRRRAAILSLAAMGSLAMIALYQLGVIKHLQEPPLPSLNADEVDAAPEAYRLLEIPDTVLGLARYAVTLGPIATGGQQRTARRPWLPLAQLLKAHLDSANAGRLTRAQWTQQRALCFWCILAACSTWATVPLVVAEARAALRRLRGRSIVANRKES